MFELFNSAKTPSKFHSRSGTTQRIHISINIFNASLCSAAVNGQLSDIIDPTSFKPTSLTQHGIVIEVPHTEPTKSYQKDPTEQIRSTRELPPLIQTSRPELQPTSPFARPIFSYPTRTKKPQSPPLQKHQMYPTPLYGSKPASRFSILRKPPLIAPTPQLHDERDDLMHMDIPAALFLATSTHSYSACPFKNPRELAENLLFRYQTAYRERTIALREMEAEKAALVEEKQGAATRAFQLKTQLNTLSASLAEQDEVMINLVN